MDLTPSKLVFHELIGLEVTIKGATNPTYDDIRGKVVDETKNMIIVQTKEGIEKNIPKKGSSFVFRIPAHLSLKHAERYVKVNGNLLLSQPESRTKNIRKIHMR